LSNDEVLPDGQAGRREREIQTGMAIRSSVEGTYLPGVRQGIRLERPLWNKSGKKRFRFGELRPTVMHDSM